MERLLTWIRDNPQLAAVSLGVAVLMLVMTVLAVAMLRAGASLRPLIWFLGFFAIVAGPQAVVHLLDGMVLRKDRSAKAGGTFVSHDAAGAFAPVSWDLVFGPDADPALIVDAKHGLGQVIGDATEARLSFARDGSSALAARFATPAAAARALDRYGSFFAFHGARGSDARGWTARRHGGQGEWVHIVAAGPELYAWTSAEEGAVRARRDRALGTSNSNSATAAAVGVPAPATLVSKRLASQTGLMIGIVSLNLVAAGFWFFKGSAWAARADGSIAVKPIATEDLRQQLASLNHRDIPTTVTPQPDGSLEINWRYGDARWLDLMRVHQMKRAHRLVLRFDAESHTVRVREFWSAFDASAGPRDLRLNWQAASGIQFFAIEHRRVLGAQLDAKGLPNGKLNSAYTFNLQELKQPIIDVVTAAGWHWQPVTWDVPPAFRWLTE